jgi:hypothetical protein
MTYTAPSFKKKSYTCPHCAVHSHINWIHLYDNSNDYYNSDNETSVLIYKAICQNCDISAIWREELLLDSNNNVISSKNINMIYPCINIAPPPSSDMPEDIKIDYIEANAVFPKSPRAAAALLRLALQKLCIHLGEEGKNINTDIRELAKKDKLPSKIIKIADTVRIVGNNAVHPGEMSNEDIDSIASNMFNLLNIIVNKTITEPKELQALYESTPENTRQAAETADLKNKTTKI